jgi:hypothetical protein
MAVLCRDAATPIADDEAASGFPERFAFRQVQTSRRRLAMTRQAVGEISMPVMEREFSVGKVDDSRLLWIPVKNNPDIISRGSFEECIRQTPSSFQQ